MYSIAAVACGQEEAIAFLDGHGFAATDQLTLAICDEQRDKALLVRRALKRAVPGIHGEILTLGQMAAKVMLDGQSAQGHVQRLLHVQGAGLTVRPHAAVIVHTVGHVGVLLDFRNHNALTDA